MTAPASPTSPRAASPAPEAEPAVSSKASRKEARRAAEAAAANEAGSSSSSARRRSSASSSVPGAEQMPAPEAADFNASGISAMIARVMVAARYLLSGNFDIVGTVNDMGRVESCVKKLARRMDQCATAVNEVRISVVNFAQTLPSLAEAVTRVSTTFASAFPFIGRMFR
jgi:hypothetical protein